MKTSPRCVDQLRQLEHDVLYPPETGLSAEDACRAAVGGSAWFCFIDCDFAIKFVAESETSGGATLVGPYYLDFYAWKLPCEFYCRMGRREDLLEGNEC